jgi:hypothetical protein
VLDPTSTSPSKSPRRRLVDKLCRLGVHLVRGSLDRVDSRRDILPRLQGLPVRVIAEVMGSSVSHGSKVQCDWLVPVSYAGNFGFFFEYSELPRWNGAILAEHS